MTINYIDKGLLALYVSGLISRLLALKLITLIDQVHHHLYHYILLLRLALGNHQREGNDCVIGNTLGTIFTIESTIVIHKPEEKSGSDAFVPSENE